MEYVITPMITIISISNIPSKFSCFNKGKISSFLINIYLKAKFLN